jgi:molybdenum cofactor biosynthesis enzyme MoaA
MPPDGVELSPVGKLLTNDEILRLATLFVRNGVTKIRLTGGEPTVRKGIVDIIRESFELLVFTCMTRTPDNLNNLRSLGLKSIGMTSNGLVLHRLLPTLVGSGLTHLNLR